HRRRRGRGRGAGTRRGGRMIERTNGTNTSMADGDGDAKAVVPACACPVAAFQKLISGKYKLRIVWDLKEGALRYSEIRSGLLRGAGGSRAIAPRVLRR